VLVIRAPTRTLNPCVPQALIDRALAEDPAAAKAEWMAEWRSDVDAWLPLALIEAAVDNGVTVRSPNACCHRDQPLAESFIEDKLILLSCALSIFAGFCEHTELLIPFTFEGVGDAAIVGIDQHEAVLGKIHFDLGPVRPRDSAAGLLPHAELRSPCGSRASARRRSASSVQQSASRWLCRSKVRRLTDSWARRDNRERDRRRTGHPAVHGGHRGGYANACRIARTPPVLATVPYPPAEAKRAPLHILDRWS
jgi:hypothetical protein